MALRCARDLGCDWHTVNDTVISFRTALVDAPDRIAEIVEALGLDETLFVRRGERHRQEFVTSIVDVSPSRTAQLLDVVPGRSAAGPTEWIHARPEAWRQQIRWGVLKHANQKLDECRWRVQNDTLGHRDRKDDPLYRA